jgi:hypothetical protein
MYIDSVISDYYDNNQIDANQLSELLIMADDFKNQSEPLFCQLFKEDKEEFINDLPF